MGDRANIVIKQDIGGNKTSTVYLYTQWNGDRAPVYLQDGIRRGKSKWKEAGCLARIIFSEMIRDDINSSSGFGIYSVQTHSERPWLLVDCDDLLISVVPSSVEGSAIFSVEPIASWTFSEYCELNLDNSSPWIHAEPWTVLLPDGE